MPRSKEISDEVRKKVVEAHEDGKGYKTISKVFDLHRSTVRQIIYKWKVFNTIDTRPRSGRPTKLDTILRRVMRSGAGDQNRTTTADNEGRDDGEEAAHISENRRIGKDGSGSAEEGESARVPGADTSPGSGVEDDGAPTDPLRPSDAVRRIRHHKARTEEAEQTRSCRPLGSPQTGSSRRAARPAEHRVEVILCCEICGSCFPTESDLETHQAEHLDETLHQCEECGKAFQSAAGLKTHKKRKHGR